MLRTFELQYETDLSELEYLEKIYKKVKIGELVKFNGKAYIRQYPKNTKYYKYPYHFAVINSNIYSGNIKMKDEDGEFVNTACSYKVVIINNN